MAAALAAGGASIAQSLRTLPANGKHGMTGETRPLPTVIIGGQAMKLSPGGIIFDQNNRTILQQNLPANADVVYQLDMHGDIQRLYILTPEERARLDQAKK
jgi:hypothetical protein